MKQRLVLVLVWCLATTASVAVAFVAVGNVSTAVAEPGAFRLTGVAADPFVEQIPAQIQDPPSGPTSTVLATETQATGSPTTTTQSAVATTSPPTSEPAQVPATTSPTQPSSGPENHTYETEGGSVTLRTQGQNVFLQTAYPKTGWSVKVEAEGPEEVEVVFKESEEEIHFKAEFKDGQLKIKVED